MQVATHILAAFVAALKARESVRDEFMFVHFPAERFAWTFAGTIHAHIDGLVGKNIVIQSKTLEKTKYP